MKIGYTVISDLRATDIAWVEAELDRQQWRRVVSWEQCFIQTP